VRNIGGLGGLGIRPRVGLRETTSIRCNCSPAVCNKHVFPRSSLFSSCPEDEGGKLVYVVTFIPIIIITSHAARMKSSTASP
jgi:hypothetical protein